MNVRAAPPEDFNFAAHVLQLNADRASAIAYIDDVGELTYGKFGEQVRRFGHSLLSLGICGQERLLILSEDRNAWPVAFLGALFADIVPVPLNTLLTVDDYAYLLDHSAAVAAVVSRALLPAFLAAQQKSQLKLCRSLILLDDGPAEAQPGSYISFEAMLNEGSAHFTGSQTHLGGIAFWLYSSGSTGRPKGVVHTHANLFWTGALYAQQILGVSALDRIFSSAKLFFAYGLGNAITFPQSTGATAVLMAERPTPAAVFNVLHRRHPTIFCAAPTLFANMLASPAIPAPGSCGLRVCTSAGEALPREVGERFAAHFGCDILDGIGSTEMLHIFISNRQDDIRYGTTGRPVPGYEVELRGERGERIGSGEIGDLWVKGPSAALEYWNDRSLSVGTFQGEWVRTGDKFSFDESGYFTYAGRNDDMLRISGQYVSPFEVESTLLAHPGVLEAAVVAVSDRVGLHKCKAFVVLKCHSEASDAMALTLKEFVKARLAPFKRPHLIEFVIELPKTATGKIQRFKLREKQDSH